MGGFFKSVGKLGLTGAATAAGGPLGGVAAGAGLGALGKMAGGGNFYDILSGGAQGGLSQYLAGPAASAESSAPSLLDILNQNKNPLVTRGSLDDYYKNML